MPDIYLLTCQCCSYAQTILVLSLPHDVLGMNPFDTCRVQ